VCATVFCAHHVMYILLYSVGLQLIATFYAFLYVDFVRLGTATTWGCAHSF